jgi:hypothetical protein
MRRFSKEATYTLSAAAAGSGGVNAAVDRLVMMKHLFDDGNLSWLRWPEAYLVIILTAVHRMPYTRCRAF